MNKKDTLALARLVRLLETDAAVPDFPAACRRLGIAPGPLNEALLRELGMGGEEFIQRCM